MDHEEVLGHLIQIETEANALVTDAQAEADRRIIESEKQNRAAYEQRYHVEVEALEAKFQKEKEITNEQYKKELERYREGLSGVAINKDGFLTLFDSLIAGEK